MTATSRPYEGRSALVTGASSGIGEAFAHALALRGANVLLSALPGERDRLAETARELAARHDVRTETLAIDLDGRDGAQRLHAAADDLGFVPDVLVNSAGVGDGGRFADASLERQLTMLHVNVEALVALTGLCMPGMVTRGRGAIINVGSTAALQPMPYFAVYAATKAFVQSFSEALWAENRETGVRVVTLCSGPVDTAFHERAGDTAPATGIKRLIKRRYLASSDVVASTLDALERDRPTVVRRLPGAKLLYYPAAAAGAALPPRQRLLATERVNRWIFEQQH